MAKATDHIELGKFDYLFGGTTPLPLETLPPETLTKLRSGGQLTEDEMAMVLRAAAGQGSVGAKLLDVLMSSGRFDMQTIAPQQSAVAAPADSTSMLVSGPVQRFDWHWNPDNRAEQSPATYYEALSGRVDPAREFFITARRVLNLVVTAIAVAIPLGIIALGIATRAPLQDIVVMAIGGSVVGVMLKTSFPRTPFG